MVKAFLITIGALIILMGGFLWLNSYIYEEKQADTEEEWLTHSEDRLQFEFTYRSSPDGYTLLQPEVSEGAPNFEKALLLMQKTDYADFEARKDQPGESPPVISVLVYRNVESLNSREWAEKNAMLSNIQLTGGEIKEVSIAGSQGVRFLADGLYLLDTVVLARGDYVYLFSAGYLDENSVLRRDFDPFLNSVAFQAATE